MLNRSCDKLGWGRTPSSLGAIARAWMAAPVILAQVLRSSGAPRGCAAVHRARQKPRFHCSLAWGWASWTRHPCPDSLSSSAHRVKRHDRRGTRHQETCHMTIQRMDNVLIVVDDLEAAKSFFIELGLELEGETQVEGPSVDRLIGLEGVRATLALMRTPDGHGRIELDKFHTPNAIRFGPVDAPVNALGIRRIMFAVEDLDAVVGRVCAHGAELIGDVVQYEDTYRLAYIRGPEGVIVGLSERIG